MGNGNKHRQGGRDTAMADALVRADQSGRFVREQEEVPRQVTDPTELTRICVDILGGTPGVYEVFGAKFEVHKHPAADFKVLRFHGALAGCDLDGEIRPGFFVPVTKFLPNPEKVGFHDAMEELLVCYLLSFDEMKVAKVQHFQRLAAEAEQVQAAATGDKLDKYRQKAGQKPVPIVLTKVDGILSATFATFAHASGVTLLVCKGFKDGTVVRVKSAEEGHPLYEQMVGNIAIMQEHLALDENDEDVVGKALLARNMREWIRAELRIVGALPEKLIQVETKKVTTELGKAEDCAASATS